MAVLFHPPEEFHNKSLVSALLSMVSSSIFLFSQDLLQWLPEQWPMPDADAAFAPTMPYCPWILLSLLQVQTNNHANSEKYCPTEYKSHLKHPAHWETEMPRTLLTDCTQKTDFLQKGNGSNWPYKSGIHNKSQIDFMLFHCFICRIGPQSRHVKPALPVFCQKFRTYTGDKALI